MTLRILIDIGHPAHVHFFKEPIQILKQQGHEIMITSREKEFALDLLNQLGIQHRPISALTKGGLLSMAGELIKRNYALYKISKSFRPDIMAAIGGVSIAQVGKLTRIPSLVFYDTENATLQNLITYPFASCVFAPKCYESWLPNKRKVLYKGYHELSYLHPNRFKPDITKAVENGLDQNQACFFLRLVSWQANHDVGENGWNIDLLEKLVQKLSTLGKVIISSETTLPESLRTHRYRGRVADVHHLLAYTRLYIGESATMASECAVLGVPAIYAAETGRGYTNEQERLYGLVKNIQQLKWGTIEQGIDTMLIEDVQSWKQKRNALLDDSIDVAQFVAQSIATFPKPLNDYQMSYSS